MINFLNQIRKNLDIIFAVVGIITIIVVVPNLIINQYHPVYYVALGIGFVCVCGFLILRDKLRVQKGKDSSKFDYLILAIACFCGLYSIWFTNSQFPNSLIGLDTWTHMRITTQELDIALNSEPSQYNIAHLTWNTFGGYFNLMHLYLRGIIELTGLNYKWVSMIFVGMAQTLGTIIFTFLIGKELVGRKVGAIASLMVASAGWVIYFGQWVIPNGIGATFSLIVAYLFIKSYKTYKQWIAWLALPIVIISLLTHILVSVWVVGTMICLLLLPVIFDCVEAYKSWRYRLNYSLLLLIICIPLLFVWYQSTTIGGAISLTAKDMESMPSFGMAQVPQNPVNNTQNNVQVVPNAVESSVVISKPEVMPSVMESPTMASKPEIVPIVHDVLNNGNLVELVIDSLGFFLYIGIALIGCLMMLRSSNLNKSWVILCFGILVIGFLPTLLGIQVLKERWWYLLQVVMAVPLAVVLVGLMDYKRST